MLRSQDLAGNSTCYEHQSCYTKKAARWAAKRALDVLDIERTELLGARWSEQRAPEHSLHKRTRCSPLWNIVQDFSLHSDQSDSSYHTRTLLKSLDTYLCSTPL